jgi:hypothetical protein
MHTVTVIIIQIYEHIRIIAYIRIICPSCLIYKRDRKRRKQKSDILDPLYFLAYQHGIDISKKKYIGD